MSLKTPFLVALRVVEVQKKLRENIKILDFLLPKTSLSHIALLFLGPPFTFHSPRTVVLNLFGKLPILINSKAKLPSNFPFKFFKI